MAKTRIISGGEAAGLLTMEACIEAMDQRSEERRVGKE